MTTKAKRLTFAGLLFVAVAVSAPWLLLPHNLVGAPASQEKTLYTCGMHPQVIQDHPGNCPICGMKLTPIRKPPAASVAAVSNNPPPAVIPADSSLISVEPGTRHNMVVRRALATHRPLR